MTNDGLLLMAVADLSWCIGWIEQAGHGLPKSVHRTRERLLEALANREGDGE